MQFTKRQLKQPELTDPADIRDINDNSDTLEEHLNAITGYDYGKTVVLGTDTIEAGKIHLNKIPADPDFGKYFLITSGTTWNNSVKEIFNINSTLPKGAGLSTEYDTAKKIENKIENFDQEETVVNTYGTWEFKKQGKKWSISFEQDYSNIAAADQTQVINIPAWFTPSIRVTTNLADGIGINAGSGICYIAPDGKIFHTQTPKYFMGFSHVILK